jgi:hypothetical protein
MDLGGGPFFLYIYVYMYMYIACLCGCVTLVSRSCSFLVVFIQTKSENHASTPSARRGSERRAAKITSSMGSGASTTIQHYTFIYI